MKRIISLTIALTLCPSLILSSNAARHIYTEGNTLKSTLANGMTVVIHETHKSPIAAINIIVNTGSATEGRYTGSGISHLVEHMLFKDAKDNRNTQKLKALGGDINGFTSHDYTGYKVTIGSEHVGEALEILKDMLFDAYFDALDLKKEKEVIVDEIRRNRDDPARFALDISWSLVFKRHPYRYPVIGHEDLFARLGKKEAEEYYQKRYSPHNMILSISGDVRKEALFSAIKGMYGGLKRNFVPPLRISKEPPQSSARHRIDHRTISLAHVVMSYRSPSIDSADFYPLDILATALGDGEGSILMKKLRDEKRIVHYITCQNYTLRDAGIFYIYFVTDPQKVDKAVDAVLEVLKKAAEEGISAADLKKTKIIARAELLNALETAENIARDMAIGEVMTDDYLFSQLYIERLAGVTAQDVRAAAGAYLKEQSLCKAMVLPKEEGTEDEAMDDGRKRTDDAILKTVMPNGIRLLVYENHSMPLCSISATFLGGVRFENSSNNGISYLISKLLLDGTKDRNEDDIKSGIESIGGTLQSVSGNNTFGITMNLLADDWNEGIDVMSDILKNSEFSQKKIEKEKSLALASIKERGDDIIRSGLLAFKQNFFGEHPYRFDALGTEESISSISRDDIKKYYRSWGIPRNMVLAVAGDIDTDKVIAEVKKRLVSFEGPEAELPEPPAAEKLKQKKEITLFMEREQSLVLIGFPGSRFSDNDRYVFEVIDSIMSGSDGRMFHNIRDRMGMTYLIGSVFTPGIEPGSHIFYAATTAWNLEPVKKAILKEIGELKRKSVPEEELEAAKKYLITSHMDALQRNRSRGLRISLDELYGLEYDNFKRYTEMIDGVTAAQVRRVAKQYFDIKNCLIVSVYGEKYKAR